MPVKIKRIYEPYSKDDGYRILIDRLWPRGIKKEGAHINKWLKEVAPSTELRKEFNHMVDKWDKFRIAYHTELKNSTAVKELMDDIKEHGTVTLLFAAKDEQHNHALVLQQFTKEAS
jgi:uncharacterized protein YeaO (DUF488 family)